MEKEKQADILLVEDCLDDTELAIYSIKNINENLKTQHFKNGDEAIRFILEEKNYWGQPLKDHLKLIILDLNMPRISGWEVVNILRKNDGTKTIPIVILSSSTSEKDIHEAYHMGVNSYVVKPKEFDGYLKKIGALASYWSAINERPT